jgi:hypothetical protein
MRKPLTGRIFFQIRNKNVLGNTPSGTAIIALEQLKPSVRVFLAVCIGLSVVGCPTTKKEVAPPEPIVVAPPAPPPKPTSLTAEAEGALKAAEQSVVEARVKRVLWTSAIAQLTFARNAAKVFDSEATLKHAREVVALCQLSTQQAASTPVTW